jgi:hypothetical protein
VFCSITKSSQKKVQMFRPIKVYYFIFRVTKGSQLLCVFIDCEKMDVILYFNWNVLARVMNSGCEWEDMTTRKYALNHDGNVN